MNSRRRIWLAAVMGSLLLVPLVAGCGGDVGGKPGSNYYNGPMSPKAPPTGGATTPQTKADSSRLKAD